MRVMHLMSVSMNDKFVKALEDQILKEKEEQVKLKEQIECLHKDVRNLTDGSLMLAQARLNEVIDIIRLPVLNSI